MTVKQLRSLRTFLQRLAKTALLKNTTKHAKSRGAFGKPISWFEMNMYQITDEVINKVIPFVDPDGEKDPMGTGRRWYSWVEFVTPTPQPANIMFSHWWGGRFQDFMAVVDRLMVDKSLSIRTAIWICTFANCQFGEDFGTMLTDCPFIQTLKTVELVVLVVDRQAGSLDRTWCALEVHYCVEHEMDFELYTSVGRVGSSDVSGGPLVEAVKAWDIRRSEASDPSYRRQILNYIAGVDELEGLQKTAEGKMATNTRGRPQLLGGAAEKRDPDAVRRINGEEEYAHEAALHRRHAKRFDDLNMMVRLSVMRNLAVGRKGKGCVGQVPDAAMRGLTLGQLRTASRKLEASCPWKLATSPWWDDTIAKAADQDGLVAYGALTVHMVTSWVKHLTVSTKSSFMELVANGPQVPWVWLDYRSGDRWINIMATLELFVEAQVLKDSSLFFCGVFSINWHLGFRQDLHVSSMFEGFDHICNECEAMLQVCSNNAAFVSDAWALYPLDYFVRNGKNIYLGCPTGVLACTLPFTNKGWVFGQFDHEIAQLLSAVDVRCAPIAFYCSLLVYNTMALLLSMAFYGSLAFPSSPWLPCLP